jgi:4-amino-4-deoxy-L-arabinose transferase-like glycosyltransferase
MSTYLQWIKKHWFTILEILLLLVIVFAHLYQINAIPRGLYLDESSIGVNAAGIANSGKDEFGVSFPLYFKAFGEYKNPVYIYTTAIFFKLFGVSFFTLRFPAFLFFILALGGVYLLSRKIFKDDKFIRIYVLIGFGFLPHYFNLSRLAFEVISQLTFTVLSLILVYKVFHEKIPQYTHKWLRWLNRPLALPALLGLSIGFTVYTYSTARALSFLFLASICGVYFNKENLKKLVTIVLFFLVALLPWFVFIVQNPTALTNRLTEVSYLTNTATSITDKIQTFNIEYNKYFTLKYLILSGDPNARHTTGFDGLVYIPVLILFFYGLLYFIFDIQQRRNRFNILLTINVFLAVIPAALTDESSPHSLRSLLISLFIFLISCFGVAGLLKIDSKKILAGLFIIYLCFESGLYLNNYFNVYPTQSAQVQGSYGLETALQKANDQHPDVIIVSKTMNQAKTLVDFDRLIIPNGESYNVQIDNPIPVPNTCVIFSPDDENGVNQSWLAYKNLSEPDWYVRLRCY